MKKIVYLIVFGLVALAVLPAAYAAPMYVPGSWDSDSWNPNSNPMTDNLDGTHSIVITGQTPGSRYNFKIVEDTNSDGGDWGPDPNRPGDNSWIDADAAGVVAFTFNTNVVADGWSTDQYRISGNADNMDPGAWTFAGDFQGELGGVDWDNAGAVSSMTSVGGGIYEWVGNIPAAGSYNGKATNTGSWDAIGSDNRHVNASNFGFTVAAPTDVVTFRVDALNGIAQVSVVAIPEPGSFVLAFGGLLAMAARRRR